MRTSFLMAALCGTLALAACDKPTIVNTPPTSPVVVPVPGPAGPQGNAGKPGEAGNTPVVVVPPAASEPAK